MGIYSERKRWGQINSPKRSIQCLPQNLGLGRGKYLRYPISELEDINRAAECSIQKSGAVQTLYFWGVAHKIEPDEFDKTCLNMLYEIRERLKSAFESDVKLTLLLSDLHGFSNNFSKNHVYGYLDKVGKMAEDFGFNKIYLSKLFDYKERQGLEHGRPNEMEIGLFKSKYSLLEKGALKAGDFDTCRERALRYFLIRRKEREKIESYFLNHILLNGDRLENEFLLPELPMIYIYNTGFRKSHKAWFLPKQIN